MLTTKPVGHNLVALMCDGFVVMVGSAKSIRKALHLDDAFDLMQLEFDFKFKEQ